MTVLKSVAKVLKPSTKYWVGNGWHVDNIIGPGSAGKWMNPFVNMDYAAPTEYEPNTDQKNRGIGLHPHRGIDTVTLVLQGSVSHQDACGNGGTIKPGDIQWMRSGRGIEHQEFHSDNFSKSGGTMEMIQIWVNLPADQKFSDPGYQAITSDKIPKIGVDGGELDLVCGEYNGYEGPGNALSPMSLFTVKVEGRCEIELPQDWVSAIFVYNGAAKVNGEQLEYKECALLEADGTQVEILAEDQAKVLVLSAEPLNEPMFARGPMVMNSEKELNEAFRDYKKGLFRQQ